MTLEAHEAQGPRGAGSDGCSRLGGSGGWILGFAADCSESREADLALNLLGILQVTGDAVDQGDRKANHLGPARKTPGVGGSTETVANRPRRRISMARFGVEHSLGQQGLIRRARRSRTQLDSEIQHRPRHLKGTRIMRKIGQPATEEKRLHREGGALHRKDCLTSSPVNSDFGLQGGPCDED
uniref:Uncharacterized protein n=1 Tax=Kalanchoe fedtschenkoi TaxID=63787 RepID=A0A7N0TIG0_KALFE